VEALEKINKVPT